ncbi:MAG: sigma-70 family RNA polymerase sigma factor [Proteobacteria bacterium]|nr:MAG: sigma-70 family RNA polymerase sigma factor [Pseudomonadota bacterium]
MRLVRADDRHRGLARWRHLAKDRQHCDHSLRTNKRGSEILVANASESPERWLDEHGDALYAYAMLRVHHSAAAEDLVQETLLAGIEGIAKFTGGSNTRTWLVSIMKHKIVDRVRKLHREQPLELDTVDEQAWQSRFDESGHWLVKPTDWGDPAATIENNALGTAIMQCIGQLPEKLRTLIVMREIDGFDSRDLIEILNLSSASNLWVMLSRGRDKLRSCLGKNWFEEAP